MDKLTDFIDLIRIRNMLLALITVTKMCEWSFLRNCNLNFFYETDVVGNIELRFVLGKIKKHFWPFSFIVQPIRRDFSHLRLKSI